MTKLVQVLGSIDKIELFYDGTIYVDHLMPAHHKSVFGSPDRFRFVAHGYNILFNIRDHAEQIELNKFVIIDRSVADTAIEYLESLGNNIVCYFVRGSDSYRNKMIVDFIGPNADEEAPLFRLKYG